MELVFFIADPREAHRVASSDDLPGDVAAEPMTVVDPRALFDLASSLHITPAGVARQERDATCQSYPVWLIEERLCARVQGLDDGEIDEVAETWRPNPDADHHERATCLSDLGKNLRERGHDERLYALFEERAL